MTETLPELLEIAKTASKGVWRECEHVDDGCQCGLIWAANENVVVCRAPAHYPGLCPDPSQQRANSRFIATFDPPTVKELVRQLEHHRETLRQLLFGQRCMSCSCLHGFVAKLKQREPWVLEEKS